MLTRYLIDQAQHAIERADAKASTLAATATAIIAVLAQNASPAPPGGPSWASRLLDCAAVTWVAAIAVLAAAIFPRFGASGGADGRLVFFSDVPRKFDLDELRVMTGAVQSDPDRLLLAQVHALSRIAVVKYRLVRKGMILLGAGGLLGLSGLLGR